ncbi:MAG: hypothetical protein PVS3B3_21000 [Ktedonobacteraceae bacterium]
MSDSIKQMRLSLRLDSYLSDYTKKNIGKDTLADEEWETVWHIADAARTENDLTPELVDDVRIALKKFETAGEMPQLSLFSEH